MSARPGGYDDAIASTDRLVGFLYVLMRDHVPLGVVEGIMVDHCEKGPALHAYSNDFLAAYAIELAERLRGVSREEALAIGRAAL